MQIFSMRFKMGSAGLYDSGAYKEQFKLSKLFYGSIGGGFLSYRNPQFIKLI